MRTLCVLFAFVAAVASSSSFHLEKLNYIPKMFSKYLVAVLNGNYHNLIFDRLCPGDPVSFHLAVRQSSNCLEKLSHSVEGFVEENESVCHTIAAEVPACLDAMVEYFSGCAKKIDTVMMKFIQDSIGSVVKYKCDATGEQLLELRHPCLTKETEVSKKSESRIEQYIISDNQTEEVSMKESMCRQLSQARLLARTHVSQMCRSKFTRDSVKSFIDAVYKPCYK